MGKTGGFITSKGLKLYYEIEGEGQPLILLNGGPGFSHAYLQSLSALKADAQSHFLRPARDRADRTRRTRAIIRSMPTSKMWNSYEESSRWMTSSCSAIRGEACWPRRTCSSIPPTFPGWSWPTRFPRRLTSIRSLARMRAAVPEATRAVYERYEQEGLYKDRDRYPDEYQAALDIAYEPVTLSVPAPEYLQDMFSKVAYDVYRVMWGEETEFKLTGTLAQFDAVPRLHEIRVPTLVIVGASDMPTIAMAQETAGSIPGARLVVFEHSRHFPFIEEPDKFLTVMREFIHARRGTGVGVID